MRLNNSQNWNQYKKKLVGFKFNPKFLAFVFFKSWLKNVFNFSINFDSFLLGVIFGDIFVSLLTPFINIAFFRTMKVFLPYFFEKKIVKFFHEKIVKIFHDFWIVNSREKLTAPVKWCSKITEGKCWTYEQKSKQSQVELKIIQA